VHNSVLVEKEIIVTCGEELCLIVCFFKELIFFHIVFADRSIKLKVYLKMS
jgi:hypothetical protein